MTDLRSAADDLLARLTTGPGRVPGVAAVATDREHDVYAGAAGVRTLGEDAPFTPDTVCAVFSTTKAVAGTVCLQLVETGSLDLDAPASRWAPALGEVQVLDGFDDAGQPVLR
ncbi:serine hydrolase domain-containing protein, partial [Jatrophihabitans endophyticus]|uniref:serine hydrolase domain-containing protein n=1 Tax=Jatrophihabitans endophyticus TaxID=1206085 RepID=UPI0019E12B27